jgi:hypothetical protein
LEDVENDDGAEADIDAEFKRRLAGLRRLPKRERGAVLRAAREWRIAALKALQARRACDRHARFLLWRSQMLPPKQLE